MFVVLENINLPFKGEVMNKKLVVIAALVFGAVGLMLANTVKAQDNAAANTDNAAMNADNSAMNADNSAMNADNAATENAAK